MHVMNKDIILVISLLLENPLSPEEYEELYHELDSLKKVINDDSDFELSWGPKNYYSQELGIYIKRNIHKTDYNVIEAKRVADILLNRFKWNRYFNLLESSVNSDFAIDADDPMNENGIYHYRLIDIIPLNNSNS